MKTQEIRQKSIQELRDLLAKTKKELNDSAANILQKKEKNVKKAKQIRRQTARILTVINEKLVTSEENK